MIISWIYKLDFCKYVVVVSNACESDITPPRWKCLSVVPVVMPKSSKQGNYRIREFLLNKAGIFNMHHQPHWIMNMPVKYFISGMFCLECPNWCQLIYCIPVHQTLWSVQETTNWACHCHTNIMYIIIIISTGHGGAMGVAVGHHIYFSRWFMI